MEVASAARLRMASSDILAVKSGRRTSNITILPSQLQRYGHNGFAMLLYIFYIFALGVACNHRARDSPVMVSFEV